MEKYTKISQIGKGTFGTVNLVERKSDKKLFALKKTYYLQE
jgi:serine/threonine protein kinase